jgi:hypothetical protein
MVLPWLDEVEVRNETGGGIAILVEGERQRDDAFVYGQWFGGESDTFAFFPGDGCVQLAVAVGELRRLLDPVPVYGIVDRDFADDGTVRHQYATMPHNGVLRLPRYTLENYLLAPACWHAVFEFMFRGEDAPPTEWGSLEAVAAQIEQAYRNCIPVAAHNRVVNFALQSGPVGAERREYVTHVAALGDRDPRTELSDWGKRIGATTELGELFDELVRDLDSATLSDLQKQVSGKVVFNQFHSRLPQRQLSQRLYRKWYLHFCPDPPDEVQELVELIRDDAGR